MQLCACRLCLHTRLWRTLLLLSNLIAAGVASNSQARIDSLGLRYLSLGLTSFSLKDMLVGLGLTAASTIDTSSMFTLKDAKALYVPATSSLGAHISVISAFGSAVVRLTPPAVG